ncbi:MAG: hypothetical protein LBV68_02535 [Spirochaetaceae bacterium]|jgi:hypothetical protein|nr:hypothetical protein [Spirochaetaceae bacterium]
MPFTVALNRKLSSDKNSKKVLFRAWFYLAPISASRFMKIAVDVSLLTKAHRGIRLILPKIDTMYLLDLSTDNDRGLTEYNRIVSFEKIRQERFEHQLPSVTFRRFYGFPAGALPHPLKTSYLAF